MAKAPTTASIKARIKEYKQIGKPAFLQKYAKGFGAQKYYIIYEDDLYDMKAIWAAAHTPPIDTQMFGPPEALKALPKLGFLCVNTKIASEFTEGKKTFQESTGFTRNPELVRAAKAKHGLRCVVCNFDFEETYGSLGEDFIECHHLKPMALDKERVTTTDDVAVVCSNCHRMIHKGGKLRTIAEMKELVEQARHVPGTVI
jgi:hypothetical protein